MALVRRRQDVYRHCWLFVACVAMMILCLLAVSPHHRLELLRTIISDGGSIRRLLEAACKVLDEEDSTMLCNGHANLWDLPANKVVFAAAHNGNAAFDSGFLVLPNNYNTVEDSLEAGFRGINIDFGMCAGEVTLIHGSCLFGERDVKDLLINIVEFLNRNPHEVIIMPTQLTNNQMLSSEEDVTVFDMDEVFKSVPSWVDKLYNHDAGKTWPTLRELIAADKRILFFPYNGNNVLSPCGETSSCPYGFNPWFDSGVETQYSFNTLGKLQNDKHYACEITRGLEGTKDFFGVNIFTTPPCLLDAMTANSGKFLREHLRVCSELNGGKQVNVVLVDFWKTGDVLDVVHEMNAAQV